MSIESTLYSILQPIFVDELYPVVHPDPDGLESEVAALYAVYLKVGGAVFSNLKQDGNLTRPRIQISIYGIDFDEVGAKEAAVVSAMTAANLAASVAIKSRLDPLTVVGALPNSAIGVPIDGYEKDTKRYVKHLEFYCWVRS
jgi:hypothetical protein